MKVDLHITEKCVPCHHILALLEANKAFGKVNVKKNIYHPLVDSRPAIVFNGASVIKGVEAIEKFLFVHIIPKEV